MDKPREIQENSAQIKLCAAVLATKVKIPTQSLKNNKLLIYKTIPDIDRSVSMELKYEAAQLIQFLKSF